MSRRRERFEPYDGVTRDALMAMQFGVSCRARRMPGCRERCCAPAPEIDLDALIWTITLRVLASEASAVVVAALVVCVLARTGGVWW